MKYLWQKKFATLLLCFIFGLSFSLTFFGYPQIIQAQENEPVNPYVKQELENLPKRIHLAQKKLPIQKTQNLAIFHYALAKNMAFLAPNTTLEQANYLLIKLNIKATQIKNFKLLKENNGWYSYQVIQIKEIKKEEILTLGWTEADCVILLNQDRNHYLALIAKQL